jgi:hypothetical protein
MSTTKSKVGGLSAPFFFCEILDDQDPERAFRYKLKAYGAHDDIEDDQCPWASCVMPVTSSSVGGVGQSAALEKGSKVLAIALDYPECQQFMILGSHYASRDTEGNANSHVPPSAMGTKEKGPQQTVDGKEQYGGDYNIATDETVKEKYSTLFDTASSFLKS